MGTKKYTVKPGDSLSKIALDHELTSWQQIYFHPENAAFRKERPNPDLIHPGDSLAVPDPDAPTLGKGDYEVSAQECIHSIACRDRLPWELIWNDSENKELASDRQHEGILLAGDRLRIPHRQQAWHSRPTDQRHRFVLKGQKVQFTLTLRELGRARANESYTLSVKGLTLSGKTDNEGILQEWIPADAIVGRLRVGENEDEYELRFGGLDPITTIRGVKSRLRNLGLYQGEPDDMPDAELSASVAEFKRRAGLPGEDELDERTRNELKRVHGD